eukprot:UN03421
MREIINSRKDVDGFITTKSTKPFIKKIQSNNTISPEHSCRFGRFSLLDDVTISDLLSVGGDHSNNEVNRGNNISSTFGSAKKYQKKICSSRSFARLCTKKLVKLKGNKLTFANAYELINKNIINNDVIKHSYFLYNDNTTSGVISTKNNDKLSMGNGLVCSSVNVNYDKDTIKLYTDSFHFEAKNIPESTIPLTFHQHKISPFIEALDHVENDDVGVKINMNKLSWHEISIFYDQGANINLISRSLLDKLNFKYLLSNEHLTNHSTKIGGYISYIDANNKTHIFDVFSKKLSSTECKYSVTKKELYAIVFALKKWQWLARGRNVRILTDHQALVSTKGIKNSAERTEITWWSFLSNFNLQIQHISGINNTFSDFLSRHFTQKVSFAICKNDLVSSTPLSIRTRSMTRKSSSGIPGTSNINSNNNNEIPTFSSSLSASADLSSQNQQNTTVLSSTKSSHEEKSSSSISTTSSEVEKPLSNQQSAPLQVGSSSIMVNDNNKNLVRQKYDAQFVQNLLIKAHADHLNGIGMYNRLLNHNYFWSSMKKDCTNFAKNCSICQEYNAIPKKFLPFNANNKAISRPFEVVQIDLLFPTLAQDASINQQKQHKDDMSKYLLVYIDTLTGYTLLEPVANKSADAVADAIVKCFALFGPPSVIISDKGSEFLNYKQENLFDIWKTKTQNLVFAGVKRIVGKVERRNRDIRTLLYKLIYQFKDNINNWRLYVSLIQFYLNSRWSRTIDCSPFFAVFGFEPQSIFPDENTTIDDDSIENWSFNLNDWFMNRNIKQKFNLQNIFKRRDEYIERYSNKNNTIYNTDKTRIFKIGQYVRFLNPKNNRFDPLWSYPVAVVHHNNKGYKLRYLGGKAGRLLRGRFPHDVLKLHPNQKFAKTMDENEIPLSSIHKKTNNNS